MRLFALNFSANGEDEARPTTVKIFVNKESMDFDDAEDCKPTQTLKLAPKDLLPDSLTMLDFVKFQNCHSITVRPNILSAAEEVVVAAAADASAAVPAAGLYAAVAYIGRM